MGLLKKKMSDPVRGTGEVVECDPGIQGTAHMQLIVTADGVPPTPVRYRLPGLHQDRWPKAGDSIPITVDRANPQDFKIDWSEIPKREDRFRQETDQQVQDRLAEMRGEEQPADGSDIATDDFDVDTAGAGAIAAAVRADDRTQHGSAAELLAKGQRMTAIVRELSPSGKTVGDMSKGLPDPNDPMYVFKIEMPIEGSSPIEAVFLHRVPVAKVSQLGIGTRLNVAVDPADPTREVAIDWAASPIST